MKEIASARFESEVLRSDTPVIVDFYTEHCPPCRQMSPLLEEIEQESASKLKVVKNQQGRQNALRRLRQLQEDLRNDRI